MPLRIYKLQPGEEVTYDLRPVVPSELSASVPLAVRVERPREGASLELLITLLDPGGVALTAGRVPIERGYMAVVQELRRELRRSGLWSAEVEFELVRQENEPRRFDRALGFGAP